MNTVYIKFNSRVHQIRGYYELATRAQVSSLPDSIYIVPIKALSLLDEQHISYRRATDEEVERAYAQVRNTAAFVLQ
ncbi:MAG: hypothetical protein A3F84_13600 [Candidatus Handelsmanbacteria bacterium RIFCSPLOWO2_12_FULL_64_10]|uniref:Uncharacterized protein n=1 Tax=Handelsmanbacteria sp. (strain RIFCSPLOWO2_12_FULL_64_10) TaxID=1817868 RepID=A0A1F6CVJ5_HANXR|nr:MAG: hypothetical protein A3F84_13600 [Candidatus Handelsmanbacteria bacterium RIFCSPLOWO2_12_FULL_64_10]